MPVAMPASKQIQFDAVVPRRITGQSADSTIAADGRVLSMTPNQHAIASIAVGKPNGRPDATTVKPAVQHAVTAALPSVAAASTASTCCPKWTGRANDIGCCIAPSLKIALLSFPVAPTKLSAARAGLAEGPNLPVVRRHGSCSGKPSFVVKW